MGGEVIVKGLLLSERLGLVLGEDTKHGRVARILSQCVMYGDRTPLFTAEQWDAFGARHYEDTLMLFQAAHRLSGLGDPEKN